MCVIGKSCCSCETNEDQALNTGCRTGVNWRKEGEGSAEGMEGGSVEGVRLEGREED